MINALLVLMDVGVIDQISILCVSSAGGTTAP